VVGPLKAPAVVFIELPLSEILLGEAKLAFPGFGEISNITSLFSVFSE
jgi:hypothetical protein